MPIDANARDLTLAVVGTGTMGRGIVQVSAQGGMNVIAYDEKPGGAAAAKEFTAKMLDRQVEKGSLSPDDAKAAVDRISVATTLDEVAKADVIIEADIRAPRHQAGDVRQARCAHQARYHHRHQHLVSAGDIDRRQDQAARARRRHALLQSCAADAPGRGDPGPAHRAVGDRSADDHRPAHDARAGAVHRQPRLPRQSHRPRHGPRVPAHPGREHRQRMPTSIAS